MTISMITPFYKGNNYMKDYWHMVRANAENLQTYNAEQGADHLLEVILVNDSPEVTPELDEELMRDTGETSRENPLPLRIQVLTNDKNRGIHRSRVNGLHASSGSHIIYLDQDDSICDDAVVIYLRDWQRTDLWQPTASTSLMPSWSRTIGRASGSVSPTISVW